MNMFAITKNISAADCLPPYQHVHHADCLKFLEEARKAYLDYIKYPLEEFLDQKQFLVISEIKVRYLREVKEGEYQVSCYAPELLSSKCLKIQQAIINPKGKTAVKASVWIMQLDAECGRAVKFNDKFVASFINA